MIELPTPSPKETLDVETRMRDCAPVLPSSLRTRTLQTCAARVLAKEKQRNRLHRRLTWALAGVFAIQWLTLFVVDAQNTRLIAGSEPPLFASVSLEQINQLWHRRSRQLAQLMEPSQTG